MSAAGRFYGGILTSSRFTILAIQSPYFLANFDLFEYVAEFFTRAELFSSIAEFFEWLWPENVSRSGQHWQAVVWPQWPGENTTGILDWK
jgi:hypothetical protein